LWDDVREGIINGRGQGKRHKNKERSEDDDEGILFL